MRKLILRSNLSPGDIVVLTATIRDLHAAHPGKFLTDVRTPCSALWEHNPHITPIADGEGEEIQVHYPLIHRSNQTPHHFIHGYRMDLAEKLGVEIPAGPFRGDIHLSKEERGWLSQVEELEGKGTRFWIVVSGGKSDFTAKWWDPRRWQEVVDHFRGKIRFVQVGEKGHRHPALSGVLDLREKTTLRQLVRLVHHADGVICPVTSLMHLAAAVPTKNGKLRPCVVVAGGREPAHWEAYPGHRFLDTIGALDCCAKGGCWKSRTYALNDKSEKDKSLCVQPVASGKSVIPRCLDLITSADVIRAVESYTPEPKELAPPCSGCGGAVKNITKAAGRAARALITGSKLTVSKEERNARINTCLKCEHYSPPTKFLGPRCSACGCFVKPKAALATEFCPHGKWENHPEVGVVIGTYAAVPYVHLQLESLKRFHPGTPCLVVDDGSPDRDRLAALCHTYGAEFRSRAARIGHIPGDMTAFLLGLDWARAQGVKLLVKFSRRWIPVAPWMDEARKLWVETGAATLNNHCSFHSFGFRSECVAMDVDLWTGSTREIERRLADAVKLGPSMTAEQQNFFLVEGIIHQAALTAEAKAPERYREWRAAHPPRKHCEGYAEWSWMGTDRRTPRPHVLWHEWTRAERYRAKLLEWGIDYPVSAFIDRSANINR